MHVDYSGTWILYQLGSDAQSSLFTSGNTSFHYASDNAVCQMSHPHLTQS